MKRREGMSRDGFIPGDDDASGQSVILGGGN